MRVNVVGLGYIGLPIACVLAKSGFEVVGTDISSGVVDAVSQGKSHIVEPGLSDLLRDVIGCGALKANMEPKESEVYIVCVPTPLSATDKSADISSVLSATKSLSQILKPGDLLIIESTCPVGSTDKVVSQLKHLRSDLSFGNNDDALHIAYCPERILPGGAIHELTNNDRIVGGHTELAGTLAKKFYQKMTNGRVTLVKNCKTAEFVKLVENSYRDVNIAFANELSMICHELGIDVFAAIDAANLHPRVNILTPGPGVGGHCLAVDPWFIVEATPKLAQLIAKSREVNDQKPSWVVARARELAKMKNGKVVCLGLTYKPDIDDVRESPSMLIYYQLRGLLGPERVYGIDPYLTKDIENGINTNNLQDIEEGKDVVLLLVGHSVFMSRERTWEADLDVSGVLNKA